VPLVGELNPHVTQCGLGRRLPPYQVAFDSSSRLAKIDMGALPPFSGGGAGSPSNAMSLGLRPTSLPSGVLIHPLATTDMVQKLRCCVYLGRGSSVLV